MSKWQTVRRVSLLGVALGAGLVLAGCAGGAATRDGGGAGEAGNSQEQHVTDGLQRARIWFGDDSLGEE